MQQKCEDMRSKRFIPTHSQGFTLIELLLVIGILALLLSITLIAINPGRQFSQANDTKRKSDINTILNAVYQYSTDNRGAFPAFITTTPAIIGNGVGQRNICADLVPIYIAELPGDPITGTGTPTSDCSENNFTDYTISKTADGRIVVTANGEITPVITATR